MPITDLLTTADVAERTGLTVYTISRLVREGKLTPAHQLPGTTGAPRPLTGGVLARARR